MHDLLIPLFPLELVLFPSQRLPLHIFEERYRQMIGECIDSGNQFGVVLARENAIVNVGCTAAVAEVTRRYPDGRFDILSAGLTRFEVLYVDDTKEYLRAGSRFIGDEEAAGPEEATQEALVLHAQLMEVLGEEYLPAELAEGQEVPLSFRLAAPLPLDVDFRQQMLILRSEAERLTQLADYFRELLPRLRLATWARQKAGGNGHGRRS